VSGRPADGPAAGGRGLPAITLRYVAGCPSRALAETRLRAALRALGAGDAAIVLERVDTSADAERLRFHGSPAIMLDGRDAFAEGGGPIGLACRIYATEEGPQGAPSVGQLRAALERAGRGRTMGGGPA
jgi:hypothetical protein